jgi:DNA-directed RNA polymerase specialized sigma24 family protein
MHLTDLQKNTIVTFDKAGWKAKEIADETSVPLKTVIA